MSAPGSPPPTARLALLLAGLAGAGQAAAQDLEPRRWTHMPVGSSVFGLNYVRTEGGTAFDPVLLLADADVQTDTVAASLAHAFGLLGKTARVDVVLPYQHAAWDGTLDGAPASVSREGFADPWLRLSVNFVGAPALEGQAFQQYRAAHPVNTIVGAALGVTLPLGDYESDKLLNLGKNRFTFRPQAGVLHSRGPWSYELTGSSFLFTDNSDFFGGSTRTQDPLFEAQGHVIRAFESKSWVALSVGYAWGGKSSIDGVPKDDPRADVLSSFSFGIPLRKTHALKFVYLRTDTQVDVGSSTDNFLLSWSARF